jgi:subtilisin family serine protease
MAELWNKLDSGLISIYSDYLRVRERGSAAGGAVHSSVARGTGLNVTLYYEGDDDLSEIEALGFRTLQKKVAGQATGTIHLEAVERLAAHPKVRKLAFPGRKRAELDLSVPDIHGTDVWSRNGSVFSGLTGKDVIIGLIDSGIDYQHPFFLKTSEPKTTRILRIWDPGLVPDPGEPREKSPALGRLDTNGQYGVEYTDQQINEALQEVDGALKLRHRDCGGHGTHVASIAGGDGRDDYKYIGVAPEASFIVAKYLDHAVAPQFGGGEVNAHDLFKDCVMYILNTAAADFPGKPVVINCSFGSALGPHDGLTADEDFLTHTFAPPTAGKILVKSAGNEAGSRQHAIISFADASDTTIVFKLEDPRSVRTSNDSCVEEPVAHNVTIAFWYRDGGPEIEVTLDLAKETTGPIAGPALGAQDDGPFGDGFHWTMIHSIEEQDLTYTGRGTVKRRELRIRLSPNKKGEHRAGDYTVNVKTPAAVELHVWCTQSYASFAVGDFDDPPVTLDDQYTISEPGAAHNIVTVAAYDAEKQPSRPMYNGSSRGPLPDYGVGVSNPSQFLKPEIAAPGVSIDAASSRDTRKKSKKRKLTAAKRGTSMAAPHVTGVIALMLQKNGTLTVQQVLDTFKDHKRPLDGADALSAEEAQFGRVDAKLAVDNTAEP